MASEKESKRTISRIGYYSIVAFSIAVIGSISWFTVSRIGSLNGSIKNNQSSDKKQSSYTDGTSSYNKEEKKANESTKQKSEDVAKDVTSEPYTPPEKPEMKFTMPVSGAVIKPFSSTELQYSKTYNDLRIHEAIDIKCDEGTPVLAAANGTVTDISESDTLGKVVTVDHGSGISVKYCGFKTVAAVVGNEVKSGETLGTSGTVPCEFKDAPHIHLEAADESGLNNILTLFGVSD